MTFFRFSCAASVDKGNRKNNEDNLYFCGKWRKPPEVDEPYSSTAAPEHTALLAVFDGMGGEADGEYASLQAAATLDTYADRLLKAAEGKLDGLVSTFLNEATNLLSLRGTQLGRRCGSTVALLLCRDDGIFAWNVGDSRIYRLHEGELTQLSTDDTEYARMLRTGEAKPGEEWALRQRHKLTQHLGIATDEMLLSPHRVRLEPIVGDRYLICSDGLTEALGDDELCQLLDACEPPAPVSAHLVQAAITSRDNISAIVVQVERELDNRFWRRFLKQEERT